MRLGGLARCRVVKRLGLVLLKSATSSCIPKTKGLLIELLLLLRLNTAHILASQYIHHLKDVNPIVSTELEPFT